MQGGRTHEKRLRAEGNAGGPASNAEAMGCAACKLDRDRRKRLCPAPARRTDQAQHARDEWAEEDTAAKRCKPTLRHWLSGECVATRPLWRNEKSKHYARQLEAASKSCEQARDTSTDNAGAKPTNMLKVAAQAARMTHQGDVIDDSAWHNRYAVLAGCLPAWADHEEPHAREHTREITHAIMQGQDLATEAAETWREAAAPAMAWMRHRTAERGLMTLIFRSWRERVEHDTPGINHDSTRWRVRRQPRQQRAGPTTRPRRRAHNNSDEKNFADEQLRNFTHVAQTYKWSPWGTKPDKHVDNVNDTTTVDENQLRRWRFKCDMMRVATYYRVTGAQNTADNRERRARVKARFRVWAASMHGHRGGQVMQGAAKDGGASRKRPLAGSYQQARTYKQRATQEELNERRLRPKRRRLGSTATCTELGKRTRDEMCDVARECRRLRRQRFGDG